ncbi:MAG: sugar ABC transporter substrate-binding protein [Burkholderiales bacterium]|nr:sugar ABC transporter substrate-binding protein [Burkholderiales bacterium]
MTTFRTWLRSLLAVLLLSTLTMAPARAANPPHVALVMKSLANPFFSAMADGAKAHAKAHAADYKLTVTGIDNETDKAAQIRIVQKLIAEKVDAIVLAPADSRDLIPVVGQALAAGILVVNIDNKLDDRVLAEQGINVPFVGPSNRAGSRQVGEFLAKTLHPHDKVAIIEGISTTTNAQARTAGFREAMEAVDVNVVAVRSGQWETNIAYKVAADLLRENADLSALLCGNDSMALGAVAAVHDAGRDGRVKVVGYDNIPTVRPMLADGRLLATADQFAGEQAVYGIELALKAIKEKTAQTALPAMVQTPVKLITK